jgi:Zn-dependent metalloprotease
MLEQIAQNGTASQRAWASNTLATTKMLDNQRQAAARGEFPTGSVPMAPGPGKQRSVHTANNGSSLPGTLMRSEGQPACGDVAVDEAYDGAGYTYDLYWDIYQRASIDNANMPLISTVHYQRGYDNAFWNGRQMVYGDGDEDLPPADQLFRRFTIAVDVIGHELTPGCAERILVRRVWLTGQAAQSQPGCPFRGLDHRGGAVYR